MKVNSREVDGEDEVQSPYLEVCKPVRDRLLLLLEVKPSVEYLHNVTKVDSGKCFSRYGSIKMTPKGGLVRTIPQKSIADEEDEAGNNSQKMDIADDDGSHADEFGEEPGEIDSALKPLPIFRTKSEPVGGAATKFKVA